MQKTKGISLIVLIITIIVMVILAGAIVLTLDNSGIIEKATDAVKETNLATVKELTQMAWAEAYADGARTQEALKAAVDKVLAKNKIDTSKYAIIVTTTGVEVTNGWVQDGTIVKRGNLVLQVGDYINYRSGVTTTYVLEEQTGVYEDIGGRWQVLGAENGKLLIMSSQCIVDEYDLFGYVDGVANLNALCEPYGKGNGALSARCITVEDVNRVTGYNPKTANYGKGQINEYGNEVTYWWTGNEDPYYTSTNGSKGDMPEENHYGNFTYFNGANFVTSTAPENATKDSPVKITTLTSDDYFYYGTTLTSNSKDEVNGLAEGSKAYNMLFGNGKYYPLASLYVDPESYWVNFGLRGVYSGCVGPSYLYLESVGGAGGHLCEVYAVVTLASDLQLNGSSENGWTF